MKPFIVPPDAKSWAPVPEGSHFPIQNLPFGYEADLLREPWETVLVRIGDQALDLRVLAQSGLLPAEVGPLNDILWQSRDELRQLRQLCFELLDEGNDTLRRDDALRALALRPCSEIQLTNPRSVDGFTDFYSGIHHASNVGKMFRPEMPPLLPNYRHIPVAYNGKASTVRTSEYDVMRPQGQTKAPDAAAPSFGPTKELDFELELGFFAGPQKDYDSITVQNAEDYILGFVLVNDWSARDVQRWEYQPLGPFLAKSFHTSISPWLVHPDALEPFRTIGPRQEPEPLPYLQTTWPCHYDIQLAVALQTEMMSQPQIISRTNALHLYWSFVQQLAHMTSNGAGLNVSELVASGTISGPEEGSFGSLLELSWKGTKPLTMEETGETRTFLEDGDTVIMSGYCQGDGFRVGFGELRGTVLPAQP